jgi:hypothetical protein
VIETFHVQFAEGVIQVSGAHALADEIAKRNVSPEQVMIWKAGLPGWVPAKTVVG